MIIRRIFTVFITLLLLGIFPALARAEKTLDGKVVLSPGGAIYFVGSGTKRLFPSPNVYFSHGYKFSDAVPASNTEMNLSDGAVVSYADGTLVKGETPAVYVVSDSRKLGFTSAKVFRDLGYSFTNVVRDDANLLPSMIEGRKLDLGTLPHPPGTLVNWSGAIYLVTSLGKKGIPAAEIFSYYRYNFKDVVVANDADKSLFVEGLLMKPVVELNQGRPMISPEPPPAPAPAPAPSNQNPLEPKISGVTGIFPATMQTFIFSGNDPDGDNLTLTVDWGDGSAKEIKAITSGGSVSIQHNWPYIGNYIITVRVSDTKGGTAETNRPIKVGNDPTEFGAAVTLLSPNGGGTFTQGQLMTISWRRNWVPLHTTGKVDIFYKRGGIAVSIAADIADSSYTWIPIDLQGSNDYKILVTSTGTGGSMLTDESDSPFTINAVLGAIKKGY